MRKLFSLALFCSGLYAQLPFNHFDRYSSTVSSSYTSGGTSLVVTSASGLPSCGSACNFYLIVQAEGANTEEVMLVTGISGTTLTVVGAKAGTSASNHASTAVVIAPIDTAAIWNTTAAPTVTPAPGTTTNFYIATGGSDSNPCTSGSKCQTMAHALSLIPTVLTQNYQINVADGTYSEPIDLSGFISGGYSGGNLTILGNNSTPANVVFTGTVSKTVAGNAATNVVFVAGPIHATLQGIKANATAANGIWCLNCSLLVLDNVTVAGTLSNTGINVSDGGRMFFQDSVTVSGFGQNLGVDIHGSAWGTMTTAGTLTITGPGGASTTSVCLVVEHSAGFSVLQSTSTIAAANITISGCQQGINVAGHSSVESFVSTGNISITNGSTTPASSSGIIVQNGSSFDWVTNSPGTMTIDHYSTCIAATSLSTATDGAGGRTLTNCIATNVSSGGVITLY